MHRYSICIRELPERGHPRHFSGTTATPFDALIDSTLAFFAVTFAT
jgi:hypothetical protein